MANAKNTEVATKSESTALVQGEGMKMTINNHVVALIAGHAVREVDGVYGLAPFGAGQTISRLANELRGTESKDIGIQVEVGQVEAAVDMRLVTEYGYSIPKIADQVRERLQTRIKEMTGLEVKEISIEVVDLHFDLDEEEVDTSRVR